jgi:hypothetical protein
MPSSGKRQIFVRVYPTPNRRPSSHRQICFRKKNRNFHRKLHFWWRIFIPTKQPSKTPRLPRKTPQVHHQKPRSAPRFFQNTPQNSGKNSKAPDRSGAPLFFLKQLLSTCRPYRRRHGCVRRPQLPSSPGSPRSSPRWSASTRQLKPRSAEQCVSPWSDR